MSKSFVLSALVAGAVAVPVFAGETEGHVLAYDRKDNIIVLTDKSVWQLPADIETPEDLGRGDRVHFEFESGGDDDGITAINAMHRLAVATPEGTDGGS